MNATSSEAQLIEDVSSFYTSPLRFVRYNYPWGQAGTQLANETGPDKWQTALMELIESKLIVGEDLDLMGDALQIAVASGHGVGKSTLVAWLVDWFVSTREFPQVIVTANTQSQLVSKTWRELAKWHRLSLNRHWFKWTATKFYHVKYPESWFASAIPWSPTKPEAFAGTHEKHVLVVFDESSTVADMIWETTEGAMTTPGAMWMVFGNPTRNTGRFRECFGRFKHRWNTFQVDSRDAKKADKKKIEQWIEDYGEDSDFVRVRVRGVFPRQSATQFISSEVVLDAAKREMDPRTYSDMPKIIGVDVAREGDDQSVICVRQGAFLKPLLKYRFPDLMDLVGVVSAKINEEKPDVVFVDMNGLGAGVYDRLKQLGFSMVIGVNWAKVATESEKFFNQRAQMWSAMKEWLLTASIPNDLELHDDLTSIEYGFDNRNRVQLERKEDMKARGLSSPDNADAVAMTFSQGMYYKARTARARPRRLAASWRTV